MKKPQLILTLVGVTLIILIYQLPRVVVENDQLQELSSTANHSLDVPENIKLVINQLQDSLKKTSNSDKRINFALALAKYYLDYSKLDSAVLLGDMLLRQGAKANAADVYYTSYERSPDPEKGKQFADKARVLLSELVDNDPSNLLLKNKLAMTFVASDNPMSGIMMLREILDVAPSNRLATLNLGLLSIQSGQFEKAQERFKLLVDANASDFEAKLYLSVTLIELNEKEKASLFLNEILATSDSIPAIKAMASSYLEAL